MARDKLISYRGQNSQTTMAKKYGVSQQAWSKWETGESAPSPRIMKRIEMDSGIPMEELFPDVFNNPRLLSFVAEAASEDPAVTGTDG